MILAQPFSHRIKNHFPHFEFTNIHLINLTNCWRPFASIQSSSVSPLHRFVSCKYGVDHRQHQFRCNVQCVNINREQLARIARTWSRSQRYQQHQQSTTVAEPHARMPSILIRCLVCSSLPWTCFSIWPTEIHPKPIIAVWISGWAFLERICFLNRKTCATFRRLQEMKFFFSGNPQNSTTPQNNSPKFDESMSLLVGCVQWLTNGCVWLRHRANQLGEQLWAIHQCDHYVTLSIFLQTINQCSNSTAIR